MAPPEDSPPGPNPYAPPRAEGRRPTTSGDDASGYRPLSPLAQWVAMLLFVVIAGQVLSGALSLFTIVVMKKVIADKRVTGVELTIATLGPLVVVLLILAAGLITGVLFLFFMSRANRNARTFVAGPFEFSPGATVANFFVPIGNFWLPYQAMRETWLASDPSTGAPDAGWQSKSVPALLPWWWGMYLFSTAAATFVGAVTGQAKTASDRVEASWGNLIAVLLNITAAVLALAVVRRLAEFQDVPRPRAPGGVMAVT